MNAMSLLTPVPCFSYCSGARKGLLPTPDEFPRFEGGRKPESWDGNREPGKKFGEVCRLLQYNHLKKYFLNHVFFLYLICLLPVFYHEESQMRFCGLLNLGKKNYTEFNWL